MAVNTRLVVRGTTGPAFRAILDSLKEVYQAGESMSPDVLVITKGTRGWSVFIRGDRCYPTGIQKQLETDDRVDIVCESE